MVFYPYDYGAVRAHAEYRARLVRQREDFEPDGAFVVDHVGRLSASIGDWLAKTGEKMRVALRTTPMVKN